MSFFTVVFCPKKLAIALKINIALPDSESWQLPSANTPMREMKYSK